MKNSILRLLFILIIGASGLFGQNYVTIYRSCNYEGDSQRLTEGDYLDRDIKIGNDRISAIRVPKGWSVTVYKANNLKGTNETYDSDVRCLPEQFNDAISSIRVYRSSSANAVTIYRSCNYEGDSQELREGDYRDRDIKIGNDRISSIQVPNGWSITVYKANNFEGVNETYTQDVRCLPQQFNDAISSIRVHRRSSHRSSSSYKHNSSHNNNRSHSSGKVAYDASGKVPCKLGRGRPTSNCNFGVMRRGGGNADVHIKSGNGRERVIYFQNGRAVGYNRNQGNNNPSFRATKEGDLYIITIGEERYEIPEAVVYGG